MRAQASCCILSLVEPSRKSRKSERGSALRRVILLAVLAAFSLLYFCTRPAPRVQPGETGIIPALNEDEVASLRATPTGRQLKAAIEKLRPLHNELGPIQPGDWLESHPERGQTFKEYLAIKPVTVRGKRNTLYIQPLGEFSNAQRKIVTLTADFMGRYFSLPVKIKEDMPLSVIPAEARRFHPTWTDSKGDRIKQILSTYVLDKVLYPRLPDDAAAYIAFTSSDLWPGRGWNFVFGQASLVNRVGVWSIYRFGNPAVSEDTFKLALLRTMKVSTHETGHMFSILHCIAYECNMCGSNNMAEADRQPLWLCPECMAKVCWATETDPVTRYRKLAEFCKEHGFKAEQEFYEKSFKALKGDR